MKNRVSWAAWRPFSYAPGGKIYGSARKITLHTMECGSPSSDCWPSYKGGGVPHLSVNPGTGNARQHIDFNRSAYALASPGYPNSPNMNAGINIQIEIVGRAADTGNYSDAWYDQLGKWIADICNIANVPARIPYPWGGVNGYGVNGAYRQAWSRIQPTSGIMAHSNWPFNTHWDIGNADQKRLLFAINRHLGKEEEVTKEEMQQIANMAADAVWDKVVGEDLSGKKRPAKWLLTSAQRMSARTAQELNKNATQEDEDAAK